MFFALGSIRIAPPPYIPGGNSQLSAAFRSETAAYKSTLPKGIINAYKIIMKKIFSRVKKILFINYIMKNYEQSSPFCQITPLSAYMKVPLRYV